jgi:hypothetical protein
MGQAQRRECAFIDSITFHYGAEKRGSLLDGKQKQVTD